MHRFSRFRFSLGYTDDGGNLYLSEREPYPYKEFADNEEHTVVGGDTLANIAGRRFIGLPNPGQFYWAIADFQPDPIHDPTIALIPGSKLILPSRRTLEEEILNEKRRAEFLA